MVFLERLEEGGEGKGKPLGAEDTRRMAKAYGFEGSRNVEVLSRFLRIGLRARDEGVYGATVELLGRVGRMKFVIPYVSFSFFFLLCFWGVVSSRMEG